MNSTEAFVRLPISTPDDPSVDSEARSLWLAERKKGIGSSDAAAACGLSRYKTELQLYLEKRGELEEADLSSNRRVRMGHRLEDAVAAEYELETGRKLERLNAILQSNPYPFMRASLDRVVVNERRIVELKTTGFWAARKDADWGPDGTDLVPIEYAVQVAHQLIVTGYDAADLAVLIDNDDLRIYNFLPDERLIALIIERETDFWRRVQEGDPPAPRTLEDVALIHPRANEQPVYASLEIAGLVGDMQHIQRQIKELQEQFDARKLEVQKFMGDGDTLFLHAERIATWKNSSRTTIDSKKLKAAHPEIAAAFSKTSEFRTFKIIGDEA